MDDVFAALLMIGILIVTAKWIRRCVPLLQRLFLPSSIIGGRLALIFGPQVLGRFFEGDQHLAGGLWSQGVLDT